MTHKTETTWQKPPFRQRVFQNLLPFFWFGFVVISIGISTIMLWKIFSSIVNPYPLAIAISGIAMGILLWKLNFWYLCHKFPKLYPYKTLIDGFSSKRTWDKPPACFYTEEFKEVFKNSWIPYFAHNSRVSHGRTRASSSNQFDFSTDSGTDISNFSHPANPANPLNPLHSFNTANPDNLAHNSFNNDSFSSSHDSSFSSSSNF